MTQDHILIRFALTIYPCSLGIKGYDGGLLCPCRTSILSLPEGSSASYYLTVRHLSFVNAVKT